MKYLSLILVCLALGKAAVAQTPPAVPDRQIPPAVLAELRLLQNRFDSALYLDCAPERCFPKGCNYGEHTVADQPSSTALPGLAEEKGPGAGPSQEYLTLARCSFAYEPSLGARNAKTLVKRLQIKLSGGWTRVEVSAERLDPIPGSIRLAPEPPEPPKEEEEPEPAPAPPPVPEEWTLATALRELWVTLLPHFAWMIALVMTTCAAMMLIWGWRRLGRLSPEEEILLSQTPPPAPPEEPTPEPSEIPEPEAEIISTPPLVSQDAFVDQQKAYWATRLATDAEPDPDVRALIADWLKAGEMSLLAKAVLTFPEALPKAFPDGGEYAKSKLQFSEFLKHVSVDDLPGDYDFYLQLKQHALSASVGRQIDAQGIATLHADFGASGLVRFIGTLPPRYGGLLFAHASIGDQLEASRLLSATHIAELAETLLLSNRMSAMEADHLISLLAGAGSADPLPPPPEVTEVSDLGSTFDAANALSILLAVMDSAAQTTVLMAAQARFGGAFPSWYKDIVWPDVLLKLSPEARADLFYEIDVRNLAGWVSVLPTEHRDAIVGGLSSTLQSALRSSSDFASRGEQLEHFRHGRLELAAALRRQLARTAVSFESLVT